MVVAAINADSGNIQPGAPVAGYTSRYQFDRVVNAGGTRLAAGLAKSGCVAGGIVSVQTTGIVDLSNWLKVANTRYLTVGNIYRLSSSTGKLTTTGTGQIIGLAVSKTELSLQIAPEESSQVATTVTAASDILQAQVDSLLALLNAHIAATTAHGTGSNIVGDNDGTNVHFGQVVMSNIIPLGVTITIPADHNLIMCGPLTITGTLTVDGYFCAVPVP